MQTFVPSDLKKYTIEKGDREKGSRYEGVNYFILENLLENFRRRYPDQKDFLDAGCGKGRAMVVAAHYGFTRITGIEFAKELCEEAKKNLAEVATKFPEMEYKVLYKDILDHKITNESVFFLFNPFDEHVLAGLLDNIEESVFQHPRPIYIIYASPLHEEVLVKYHYDFVYRVRRVHYLQGLIAERR